MAELQLDRTLVKINRFYDDFTTEGVRKVEPLGYDKMVLIGDGSFTILGEAVNRHLLLDLNRKKKVQTNYAYSWLGLIDFVNLKEFSSATESCILTVFEKYI